MVESGQEFFKSLQISWEFKSIHLFKGNDQSPPEIKIKLMELEILYQKSIKSKWSLIFNKVC